MSISILIASKDFPSLYGLEFLTRQVLGEDILIGFAESLKKTYDKLKKHKYDLVISSTNMNGINTFKLIKEALAVNNAIRVLAIGPGAPEVLAPRYLDIGAYGYICAFEMVDRFKEALLHIIDGKRYFRSENDFLEMNVERDNWQKTNPFSLLSKREFEVMNNLLRGKYIKEIANELSLSISSVSTYRVRVLNKLKLNNILELSMLAKEYNLVIPENEEL